MAKKGDVPISFVIGENQIGLLNEVLKNYIDITKSYRYINFSELSAYEFCFRGCEKFRILVYGDSENTVLAKMVYLNYDNSENTEYDGRLKYINDIPAAVNKLLAKIKQKNIDNINSLNSNVKMLLDTIDAYRKENNQIDNLLAGQN